MPGAPEKADSCKHSELLGEDLGQEASRHSQNSNLSVQGVLFHPRTHWVLQPECYSWKKKKKRTGKRGWGCRRMIGTISTPSFSTA